MPAMFRSTESVLNDRARMLSNGLTWLWLVGIAIGLCRLLWMFAWVRSLDRKSITVRLEDLSLSSCLKDILISERLVLD